jgi:hypothetical protein
VEPLVIDAVFAAFQPFERYGFNKAHATCYGLIAYQTAYLKANFTVDYMAAVLSAFRDTEEKVAAAVAECRRLGIEVRPPDVTRSAVEFTVEDDGIRFGLLAVKNVGQGAIESIIAAREADGPFRSLSDFCTRIDLRLTNRKVLESLAKVGALSGFGHPAQVLEGLDDAIAVGQATQRDRATGQTSMFDVAISDTTVFETPLPQVVEAPVRERLRWEKELLGLYLSEHPMGEISDRVAAFVTAYAGDLKDESLDGQRLVVAGIVVGSRTVITRARATMAVVTLEDLQGSIEIVVFPKLFELTRPTWQEGAILLVAGRVDHRGEEVSLLADLVVPWEDAVVRGQEAISREVAAGERGAYRRREPVGVAGPGGFAPNRSAATAPVAVGPGSSGASSGNGNGHATEIPYISPLRGGVMPPEGPLRAAPVGGRAAAASVAGAAATSVAGSGVASAPAPSTPPGPAFPPIEPAEPLPTYLEGPDPRGSTDDLDLEPALPDEVRARVADEADAPTAAIDATGTGAVLHVRFSRNPSARLVPAMEALHQVIRERPGDTPVVIHVPGGTGGTLPMPLRTPVAYDADLLSEIQRRVGADIVDVQLGGPPA